MRVEPLAEVDRCGFVESVHFGSVIGLDPSGAVVLSKGDITAPILPRSSLKPLQSLACLTAGAALTEPQLAIAAGSHSGEDMHAEVVEEILAGVGLDASALRCPATWPEDEQTRIRLIRSGARESKIRMNCSGKHAAMLAACVVNGWDTKSYLDIEQPMGKHVRATLEELSGEKIAHDAVDGCGAPLFGLTLAGLARAIQTLAMAGPETPAGRVANAMRARPELVGGTGHVNTTLMRMLPGSLAKGGAEGVLVAAAAAGHSVAVKVIGGSSSATTPIVLAALAAMGVDTSAAGRLRTVPVVGGGRKVGEIRATL